MPLTSDFIAGHNKQSFPHILNEVWNALSATIQSLVSFSFQIIRAFFGNESPISRDWYKARDAELIEGRRLTFFDAIAQFLKSAKQRGADKMATKILGTVKRPAALQGDDRGWEPLC